jgi:hypothetical protein
MAWFDVAGGRLRFRRVDRHPVREWLASPDGVQAVDLAGKDIRFALFGRARAGRRRLMRTIWQAVQSSGRAAMSAECERYLATWSQLAYAPVLPRVTVNARRLVVVPRTMILGRAASPTATRLSAALGASVPDGFKSFFARWVLRAMDEAMARSGPTPKRPLHAAESWACVHMDTGFLWVDPLISGDAWRGHVVMYELPPGGLGRRDRQAVGAAIAEVTKALPNLTRVERDGTVRMAFDQMATLRF